MNKVKLLSLAEKGLDEICQYLSQFYPGTPGRFLDALETIFDNLRVNPKMYPVFEYNNEYRRFVIDDFLGFYITDEKDKLVRIYRILYGKRSITTILDKLQAQ